MKRVIDKNNVSLTDLLYLSTDEASMEVHGPIPARVNSFDPATQRCSAQPVNAIWNTETGQFVAAPIIPNIPIAYPHWTGGVIYWPLAVGSYVQLVPQDSDISTWISTGSVNQVPKNPRTCSWSDIIAIPGPLPTTSPIPSSLIGDGLNPVIAGTSVYLGSGTATDYVALASVVMQALNTIKAYHNGHKHTETGTTTGVPDMIISDFVDVKSTKVKAV